MAHNLIKTTSVFKSAAAIAAASSPTRSTRCWILALAGDGLTVAVAIAEKADDGPLVDALLAVKDKLNEKISSLITAEEEQSPCSLATN